MIYDLEFLVKHRIHFWKEKAGWYRVFQFPENCPRNVDHVELGIVARSAFGRHWIFVPSKRSVCSNGIGLTRWEAVNDALKLETSGKAGENKNENVKDDEK